VVIVKYIETQLGFTLFLVSLLESIFGYKVFTSLNDWVLSYLVIF